MFSIAMGCLSALSIGIADFIASQSSERIGAARALAGILLVSSIMLTAIMFVISGFEGLLVVENVKFIIMACLHGVTMAIALLLFFYAISVGKVSVVAPIIAAHPVVIVLFFATKGDYLLTAQLISIALTLLGVGLVAATNVSSAPDREVTKRYEKWQIVVLISIISSIVYNATIIFLQNAAQGITDLQVLWFGRCIGLFTVSAVLFAQKKTLFPPTRKWRLFFVIYGSLDSGGLLFILFGTNGNIGDALTAVVSSTFPIVTIALAWIFMKERLSRQQFCYNLQNIRTIK